MGEAKLLRAYTNKEKTLGADEKKEQTQTQNESQEVVQASATAQPQRGLRRIATRGNRANIADST